MTHSLWRVFRQATTAAILVCLVTPAIAQPSPGDGINDGLRPPHSHPLPASDEAGLWEMAGRAEQFAKSSGELNSDPVLNSYIQNLICKLSPEYCDELRPYVLDRPFFNASAAPNGYIEVFTGLLLRAETEDQLAFVLGHEISHYARSHGLARWRKTKDAANRSLMLSAGIAIAAGAASYSAAASGGTNAARSVNSISAAARELNNLIYLGALSEVFAYGREEEFEADHLGYMRAVRAGYRGQDAVELWNKLVAETAASQYEKVRNSGTHGSIFATHPLTQDRIAALQTFGPSLGSENRAARVTYRAIIRPYLSQWLKDDLRRRDFGQSLFLLERLASEGEDLGLIAYFRGEAHRLRRAPEDVSLSITSYEEATHYPDVPSAAWRELGDARNKVGDGPGAIIALQHYLDAAPQAQDRWLVEATLKSLKQGSGT